MRFSDQKSFVGLVARHVREFQTAYPAIRQWTVAYSGGMDSHVLLHVLTLPEMGLKQTLRAVYVDHGLQGASNAWGEHCARVCRELGVPFRSLKVDARAKAGESPEAAARRARYAAFSAQIDTETALLTAHHCDDQAETLLLQLLRGAGPHGLAAMPNAARLGQGWLLRPLLEVSRPELSTYARQHHLRWVEDGSNTDTDFDRNYLRLRVLPLLQERWPSVCRNLARSARLCAEAAEGLDSTAAADLRQVITERPDALHLPHLIALSDLRQRNVVRYWLRQLALPMPDHRQLRHLLHDLINAREDRQPCVRWPGGEARRYRQTLYAMPPLTRHQPDQRFVWRAVGGNWPPLNLPGIGQLRLQQRVGDGLRFTALADLSLTVQFRTGSERFRPAGRRHSQELKKLLQDAQIPPWQRDRLPLLYHQHELLAVVGLGIAAEHRAGVTEKGWEPVLIGPS